MKIQKKIQYAFLIIIVFAMIFMQVASAQENTYEKILNESLEKIDEPNDESFNFEKTVKDTADGNLSFSFKEILENIADIFLGSLNENISMLIKIAALCVFSGVMIGMGETQTSDVSSFACLLVISGLSVKVFASVVDTAEQTSDSLLMFIQSLLPVTASLSVGAMASAFHPAMFISMQLSIYICTHYFIPLILFSVVLSVINGLSARFHLVKLTETCRLIVKWGMGIVMTVYVGLLSLQGFSTSFAGGIAGKTFKYAIGNFIPMVGGVLAESTEAVMSSLLLIKSALSIGGIIAVVYLCASPLINILVTSFCFRLAGSICEPICDKRISNLMSDMSSAISLVFSLLLMMCVMFILSIGMIAVFSAVPVMMR